MSIIKNVFSCFRHNSSGSVRCILSQTVFNIVKFCVKFIDKIPDRSPTHSMRGRHKSHVSAASSLCLFHGSFCPPSSHSVQFAWCITSSFLYSALLSSIIFHTLTPGLNQIVPLFIAIDHWWLAGCLHGLWECLAVYLMLFIISARRYSLSCARLMAGRVTTLSVRRPLSVNQHGQLSQPSLQGRLNE